MDENDKIESAFERPKSINWKDLIKPISDAIHKWGLWAILFIGIGVYGGVTASKGYYNSKMQECIKLQGLVYQDKIYTITLKL